MEPTKTTLIVQPGDSFFPVVHVIDRAHTSINITVFRLDDLIIARAVVAAHKRGVRVRVLVETNARGSEDQNHELMRKARVAGIEVKETAGAGTRPRYHSKMMTVDGTWSLVFTFNTTSQNLHYTRGFGVVLFSKRVATELNRLFSADWNDEPFAPDGISPLLISPYNSRAKMEALLGGATESIHVWDARLSDPSIIGILARKAKQGVDVRVLGQRAEPEPASAELQMVERGLTQAGLEFRAIDRFRLHAKCTVVDGKRAVLGSMNMRRSCFDLRREVSIRVKDPVVVKKLESVFRSDWEQKPPALGWTDTVVPAAAGPRRTRIPLPDEIGFALLSRTDAIRRHALRAGTTTIGRADDNDVVISDDLVSRYHARISVEATHCTITDLDTANGTFVGGERVAGARQISPGDVISFADVEEFRFVQL